MQNLTTSSSLAELQMSKFLESLKQIQGGSDTRSEKKYLFKYIYKLMENIIQITGMYMDQ